MTNPLLAILFLVVFVVVLLLNRTGAAEFIGALVATTVFFVGLKVFGFI